jgi:ABC-type sugar transport system permease subunit
MSAPAAHLPGIATISKPTARVRGSLHSAQMRHRFWGYAFIAPMLLVMLVFKFVPAIQAIGLSFTSYDLLSPPTFNGIQNYVSLIQDPLFHQSVLATIYFVVGSAIPVWAISLGLAVVFTFNLHLKSFLRTVYFLPHILPGVVFAILWRFIFQPYGLLNSLLQFLHVPSVGWLTDPRAVMPAFIIATDWSIIPFFMIIYLTALQNIPQEYNEAAAIDGATGWQRFRFITLPLLRPTVLLVVVVSVIFLSKVFTSVLVLTGGGPDGASRVLPMFIYEMGLQYFKMGRATAASMFLLVALIVFTVIQLNIFKDSKDSER